MTDDERQAWQLRDDAATAALAGDLDAAHRAIDAAMTIVASLDAPKLEAELALVASEVAAALGDAARAAAMSVVAEQRLLALGDDRGLVVVRYARALHALRADGDARLDGMDMAASLLPAVDAAGGARARIWLRLELACALADSRCHDDALELASQALDLAQPPHGEWAASGCVLARLLTASGRPEAAARLASGMLADAPTLAAPLRVALYQAVADALRALGHPDAAVALGAAASTLAEAPE